MPSRTRLAALCLVLAASLALVVAPAAAVPRPAAGLELAPALEWLWSRLGPWWKLGPECDPNGHNCPAAPAASCEKLGPEFDPDGAAAPGGGADKLGPGCDPAGQPCAANTSQGGESGPPADG